MAFVAIEALVEVPVVIEELSVGPGGCTRIVPMVDTESVSVVK